jgi:hypothetical protein
VRKIERVLGGRIERRRLPGFNYGSYEPLSQAQPGPRNGNDRRRDQGRNNGANNGRRPRRRRRRSA